MAKVRIKLDHGGMRDLLRSDAVRKELERRAKAIAAAAGEGFAASSTSGHNRALAMAYPATVKAWAKEQRDRVLTRAIDAGRQ